MRWLVGVVLICSISDAAAYQILKINSGTTSDVAARGLIFSNSPSKSASPSATPSKTSPASVTASRSSSASPSVTHSPSPLASSSRTISPVSVTPSTTSSPSATRSSSAAPSASSSTSRSFSVTPTPLSVSPTTSPSATASESSSPSASATRSQTPQASPTNLVANPGFETGSFSSWTVSSPPAGSVIGVASGSQHGGAYAAYFGDADCPGANDTISQTLTSLAGPFTFSFWLQNTGGAANVFEAFWDGAAVLNLANQNSFSYTQFSYSVSSPAANPTIAFSGCQAPAYWYLDDVNVLVTGVVLSSTPSATALSASVTSTRTSTPTRSPGSPSRTPTPVSATPSSSNPLAAANVVTNHGGPSMLGTLNLYYIWYGNWTNSTTPEILEYLAKNVGGSPWFNTTTTYWDYSTNASLHNSVHFVGSYFPTPMYQFGWAITEAEVQTLVKNSISAGAFPQDANGIYFVFTDVNTTVPGLCTTYCAWHNHYLTQGVQVKYALVGSAILCNDCGAVPVSPNGNSEADAMASSLAHEMAETFTDPLGTAWYDGNHPANEIADKCAYTYGTTYTTPNGAKANLKWGTRNFLIQQLWVNGSPQTQHCVQHYP